MSEISIPAYFDKKHIPLIALFIGGASAIFISVVPAQYLPTLLVALLVALPVALVLSRFPEVALALFLTSGVFKGNPMLVSLLGRIDLTVFLAAILWVSIAFQILKRDRLPINTKFVVSTVLFIVLMIASLIYTSNMANSLDKTGRFIMLTTMGMVSPVFLLRDRAAWRRLLITLAILSTIVSLRIIFASSLSGAAQTVKVSGTQYLALGRIAGVGAILGTYYYLVEESTKKWLALMFSVFSVGALFLSGGRGPLVSLFATFVMVWGLVLFSGQISAALRSSLIRVFAGIGLTSILSWFFLPSAFQHRLLLALGPFLGQGAADTSVTQRFELYSWALSIITQFPILGVGIGEFPAAVGIFRFLPFYSYPHNIFLEIGAEMGLLGLVAFLSMLFMAVYALIREIFVADSNSFDKSAIILGLMMLTYVLLSSLTSGDINGNKFFWFTIGFAYATTALFGGRTHMHRAISGE